jgi:ATP-dependent DNA helicase RecG
MTLDTPIDQLRGVGAQTSKKLHQLGLNNVHDIISYYPRRYDDFSAITPIKNIRPGLVTIRATLKQVGSRYARRGLNITEAVASDETGSVRVIWFNQPYRATSLHTNVEYFISGDYALKYQRLSITNPGIELVSNFPLNTARIVPVYRETKGLNSKYIRKLVSQTLPIIRSLPETLPPWIISSNSLMSRSQAVESIHFPTSSRVLSEAKRRLGFEEVFELTLASLLNRYELLSEKAPQVQFVAEVAREFVKKLPFKLTNAQRQVAMRIYEDMAKRHPMNRLVEGDVGSGKTIVAAMAAIMVLHSGHQVAFMAPTELLARQHADTLQKLLQPIASDNKVGLLVGGMSQAQKKKAYQAIAYGRMQFIIGTHTLIQENVNMGKLELVIIDEQHRFGVEQRKKLLSKAGHMPHVLSLTATPIPRSLALTLYGDLDISILSAKPLNRQPIITKIISPNSRAQMYKMVNEQISRKKQIFVVCPVITESLNSTMSVEKIFEQLSKIEFKHHRVGLLHGKMKADQKNTVMQDFINHKIDILVSTTVIEVGVDIPNATTIIIEAAERYGLAQLHQLRGRVGRSSEQGYCYLVLTDSMGPTRRLRALESSNDGFKLAELDLEIRGPGAIYGQAQHGQLDLRVANLTDSRLIASAHQAARNFIDKKENLLQYTELKERINSLQAVTSLN